MSMQDYFWRAAGAEPPATNSAPPPPQVPQANPNSFFGHGRQVNNAFNGGYNPWESEATRMSRMLNQAPQEQEPAPNQGMQDDFWSAFNQQPNMNSNQPQGGKSAGGK